MTAGERDDDQGKRQTGVGRREEEKEVEEEDGEAALGGSQEQWRERS